MSQPRANGATSWSRRNSAKPLQTTMLNPSGFLLQPAPHPRAVAAIDIAELALEIGFLAGDDAVADDEDEGHQRQQEPEAVEGNGQADQPQHHAEVDGIAREEIGRASCR